MAENQLQPPQNILNALQIFANAAWHLPSTFWRIHRSSGSRDIEYLHLQDHSVALQYLFGSAFAWYNKIFVRDEHREALQALQTDSSYKQGIYIIGQPGIGKTFFLVYALLERLREHKPVAVQLHASNPFYVLFTHTCTPYPLSDPTPLLQEGVWALNDLSNYTTSQLSIFQGNSTTVVQTTPLSIKYWERCNRYSGTQMFTMNTWSKEEIADFSSLLGLDVGRMTALAAKWGGVPRTLLQQYANDEPQQEWELRRFAASAAENYMTLHTLDAEEFGAASTIFFVLPLKDHAGNVCRRRYVIRVPTPTLRNALAMALPHMQTNPRVDFFLAMFAHPATRACARNIYANWFHFLITSGIQHTFMWKSVQSDLSGALYELAGLQIIRGAKQLPMNPPYYWIPARGQLPGIDCALVTESRVIAIQLATYFQPSSPQIGLDTLRKRLLPTKSKSKLSWIFLSISITRELADRFYCHWESKLTDVEVGVCVVDPVAIGIPDELATYTDDDELGEE